MHRQWQLQLWVLKVVVQEQSGCNAYSTTGVCKAIENKLKTLCRMRWTKGSRRVLGRGWWRRDQSGEERTSRIESGFRVKDWSPDGSRDEG